MMCSFYTQPSKMIPECGCSSQQRNWGRMTGNSLMSTAKGCHWKDVEDMFRQRQTQDKGHRPRSEKMSQLLPAYKSAEFINDEKDESEADNDLDTSEASSTNDNDQMLRTPAPQSICVYIYFFGLAWFKKQFPHVTDRRHAWYRVGRVTKYYSNFFRSFPMNLSEGRAHHAQQRTRSVIDQSPHICDATSQSISDRDQRSWQPLYLIASGNCRQRSHHKSYIRGDCSTCGSYNWYTAFWKFWKCFQILYLYYRSNVYKRKTVNVVHISFSPLDNAQRSCGYLYFQGQRLLV